MRFSLVIFSKSLIPSLIGSILLLGLLVFQSCGGDSDQDGPGFDRAILLEEMANKLIIPNFETLQSSVNTLAAATSDFNSNPSLANLGNLRSVWKECAIDYQHCSAFGFGPGDLNLGPFASVLGVFPVDENQVEQNIANPDFNLAASFDRDVRGFYAIEYLIYGNGLDDTELIATFDQNRKAYLQLLVDELKATFDEIVGEWKGGYKEEFIGNTGTSAGSPVSLIYNEFVKDYENLKNFKVELPAGLTAGQTGADPRLVEAYYSGISLSLLEEHFASSKNIWLGRSRDGENFVGFEEYLETVVGGPDLIAKTTDALDRIDAAVTAIPGDKLSEQLETAAIVNLRNELQANTANFKSSMSSLLGISITFNSGDGD